MNQMIAVFQRRNSAQLPSLQLAAMQDVLVKHGLKLGEDDVRSLVRQRDHVLHELERIEFGRGVLPDLIGVFAGSPYLTQDTLVDDVAALQAAFYRLKEEVGERLSDDELIDVMRSLFDDVAHGAFEFFESVSAQTLLDHVAAIDNDTDETWSEYDSHQQRQEKDAEDQREDVTGIERLSKESEQQRPDEQFAASYYDAFDELYSTGFDFNSRIGGSTL